MATASITLSISDGRRQFYRWDTERYLITEGLSLGSELHFDTPDEDMPVRCTVEEKDGRIVCKVPNELLQHSGSFIVWVYAPEGTGMHTVHQQEFTVKDREKPRDYIYTEDELDSYTDLKNRVEKLESDENLPEHTHSYNDLEDKPTKVSELENDAGFITKDDMPEGGGVTSDWSVNDPEAAGYVKNRTHYIEMVEGAASFDGDLTGKEYYDMGEGIVLVKMSDTPLTMEELLGSTVTGKHNIAGLGADGDTVIEFISNEDNTVTQQLDESSYMIIVITEFNVPVIYNFHGDLSSVGVPCPEGTYFAYMTMGEEYLYAQSLSCLNGTQEVVHKIDEKYLPDKIDKKYLPDNLVEEEQLASYLQLRKKFTDLPNSSSYRSIAYGNGKFVAVSTYSSKALYSEDGVNWNVSSLPTNINVLNCVVYGAGKFVAVGGKGYAAYSEDGINWIGSVVPDSSRDYHHIAYGNGKFVALSSFHRSSGAALYSEDGINWNKATEFYLNEQVSKLVYGNGKFVATKAYNQSTIYSEDGIIWESGSIPTSEYKSSAAVIYGNGKFMAYEIYPEKHIFTSEDGVNWDIIESEELYAAPNIYGNGKFVAIDCYNGVISYSEDGIKWKNKEFARDNPELGDFEDAAYGNGRFVALYSDPNITLYSDDGINWRDSYEEIVLNDSVISLNGNLSLDGYATEAFVQEAIADAPIGSTIKVPTKVSELENDAGFITKDDIPEGYQTEEQVKALINNALGVIENGAY